MLSPLGIVYVKLVMAMTARATDLIRTAFLFHFLFTATTLSLVGSNAETGCLTTPEVVDGNRVFNF